ncbi:hypothetical protein EV1_028004 [Malus domestica]
MSSVSGVQSPSCASSALVNYNMEAKPYRPDPKSLGFIADLLRSKSIEGTSNKVVCAEMGCLHVQRFAKNEVKIPHT